MLLRKFTVVPLDQNFLLSNQNFCTVTFDLIFKTISLLINIFFQIFETTFVITINIIISFDLLLFIKTFPMCKFLRRSLIVLIKLKTNDVVN